MDCLGGKPEIAKMKDAVSLWLERWCERVDAGDQYD